MIHFWCPNELASSVSSWDPDAAPNEFASVVGHTLLEPYVRLRRAGVDVELGDVPSRRPQLVVATAGMLWRDKRHAQAVLRAIERTRDRYVLVRGDVPLWWHLPVAPTVEVMPNFETVTRSNQTWLPPLPQRGLVPRNAGSVERIQTVALKCNPENLPEELADPAIDAALGSAGAELWIDMPTHTDGADQRWHDFAAVDAVLCARRGVPAKERRKPATKLINAWVAGCIPLATREPAYLELGRHGEDVWFLDTLAQLSQTVGYLNETPDALARLAEGVERRRREFEPAGVLALWRDLLDGLARAGDASSEAQPYVRSTATRVQIAAWRLRSFHHGARVRNRVRDLRDGMTGPGVRSLR